MATAAPRADRDRMLVDPSAERIQKHYDPGHVEQVPGHLQKRQRVLGAAAVQLVHAHHNAPRTATRRPLGEPILVARNGPVLGFGGPLNAF